LRSSLFCSLLVIICAGGAFAEPAASRAESLVGRYLEAAREQQERLRGVSMEVDIEAELPRLHKKGRLHALRMVSRLGRITYDAAFFEGDRTIKTEVIARFLNAESAPREGKQQQAWAITPANYRFKYKASGQWEGREALIFKLTPRKKRQGLFVGELWIDAQTYVPLKESGRLVKNPSIFLKRIEFVREYQLLDGFAAPRVIRSTVETRLVGTALLTVTYGPMLTAEPSFAGSGGSE
jgi:hypothetical protein